MQYDIGYVIVFMMLSGLFGFSIAYNKYQKVIHREFQRGKEVGRASQRITQ